jgi:hypothetical protein
MVNQTARADGSATRARRSLIAAVALTALVAAGCSTHDEDVRNPCPELSGRGAVALAKLGLTPRELKEQAKC